MVPPGPGSRVRQLFCLISLTDITRVSAGDAVGVCALVGGCRCCGVFVGLCVQPCTVGSETRVVGSVL